MSEKVQKISLIIFYILLAIGIVFVAIFYFGKKVPGTEGTIYEEPMITGKILSLGVIYTVIALLLALIFPLFYVLSDFKKAIKSLIGVAFFLCIIGISYALASPEPIKVNVENVSPITFKLVDSGLIASYILAAIAFLGIIISEISNVFK